MSRDLQRFPSELREKGAGAFRVVLAARGWLGRWLGFEGYVEDARAPILYEEFLDMMGLYLLEKEEREEEEEARRQAGHG